MKLITQVGRKYKDIVYTKSFIIIPKWMIALLGWKKGEWLHANIEESSLIIKNKKE